VALFCVLQEADIDNTAAICNGVRFYRSKLGRYSYIGNNSFVSDTDIGNFTSISSECYIGGTSHPTEWISTSPVFHKWGNIMKKNFSRHEFAIFHRTIIGNDVWIGNRVMIKAGVTIGDGAIIGMGSIVTKDINSYEIWVGNPAKFLRKRFNDEQTKKIIETQWWKWSDTRIETYAEDFNSLDKFMEKLR